MLILFIGERCSAYRAAKPETLAYPTLASGIWKHFLMTNYAMWFPPSTKWKYVLTISNVMYRTYLRRCTLFGLLKTFSITAGVVGFIAPPTPVLGQLIRQSSTIRLFWPFLEVKGEHHSRYCKYQAISLYCKIALTCLKNNVGTAAWD